MVQPKSRISIQLKTVIHDGEATEENKVTAAGIFHQKETLAVLTYKEEMEGYGAANTLITIQSEKVSIKRTGAVSMHQQFRLHHPTENVYQHPHGNIHMETFTDRISYIPPENKKPGRLELEYNVKLNGQAKRKHTLELLFTKEDAQ